MKYGERHQRQFDFIDTEAFFSSLKDRLDERTFRLVVAAMAEAGGHFNLTHIARCADVSRPVIYSGITDTRCAKNIYTYPPEALFLRYNIGHGQQQQP